jgi:Fatty acid hydroxylase
MSSSAARTVRGDFTLADAWRQFWRHPSPWMIGVTLVAAMTARIVLSDWQITDALIPAAMAAVFPFFEWMVHVSILHWRPRRVGRLIIDPLLARKHREHHADPRIAALVFIPGKALPWVLAGAVAIALLAFPRVGLGLTFLAFAMTLGFGYEWTHHLIHTDYKPRTPVYRAVWRNHRLHHFKNEHYWFTITTSGTADRVLRTHPDPATVPTSPTAKKLHAGTGVDARQNRQWQERSRQKRGKRHRNCPKRSPHRNQLHRIVFQGMRRGGDMRHVLELPGPMCGYAGGLYR